MPRGKEVDRKLGRGEGGGEETAIYSSGSYLEGNFRSF